MRFVIIGAGAVGGVVGGLVAETGGDVVLVARGEHLAAVRRDGLRLATDSGERIVPVAAVAGPDEVSLRPDDVLVLTVKTQHTVTALDAWSGRPVTGPDGSVAGTAAGSLPVVCLQNGLENERLALRRFRTVLGGLVWLPAGMPAPGQVVGWGRPRAGWLRVGTFPGGQAVPGHVAAIASGLSTPSLPCDADPDIMRWKRSKVLQNLANSVEALLGDVRTHKDLLAAAKAEGRRVFEAAGLDVVTKEEELAGGRDQVRSGPLPGFPAPGSSTTQSLQRGSGSAETDYLDGEIVLLGRLHGVPTPIAEALQTLMGRAVRESLPPGSFTLADVQALVGAPVV